MQAGGIVTGEPVKGGPGKHGAGFHRFVVPEGKKGGDVLFVCGTGGNGTSKQITIPKGLRAGDTFLADIETGTALKEPARLPSWLQGTLVICTIQ